MELYDLYYADGGIWKGRVLIPLYSPFDGELMAIQGRAVNPAAEKRYVTRGARPLYVPDGLDETVCLVEGPFDVFNVNRVIRTMGILGNQISERQWMHLGYAMGRNMMDDKTPVRRVLIWLDNGAQAEAYEIQKNMARYVQTEVIDTGEAKDPGSMTHEQIQNVLKDYV